MQVEQAPGMSQVAEQVQQSKEAIEALVPSTFERKLTFDWVAPDGSLTKQTYIQAELGMFPVQEFTTLISDVISKFITGEMGMKIGELFRGEVAMPSVTDGPAVERMVEDNQELIAAFIKLVQILPELQQDIICLSLGVPRKERKWAKEQMAEPPHRGGLTVNEGFDILIVFIRQNAPLLKETLLGKARELVDVFQLEVMGVDKTEASSPSTSAEEEETMAETLPSSRGGTPSSTSSPATPVSA